MSHIKKNKFAILILFLFISFFMFGCENSTPVKDIYFNLEGNKQIVLIVGQTLEMDDYIEIKPAYATNKKYKIISFDEDIVDVENNKLIALQTGTTQIKVVADDNKLKESIMSVTVKASKTILDVPKNFKYNEDSQTFTFDPVIYASSYTIKINGNEIELGNTNSYSLSQLGESAYNKKLVAQVRANAPSYTYALENSSYSNEFPIYQAGVVSNVTVQGGVLTFDKVSKNANYNIYVNNEMVVEKTTENVISLKSLNEALAGTKCDIKIETLVGEETKNELGEGVKYCNSFKYSLSVNVLGLPNLVLVGSDLSWQNVIYASGYEIYVDGVKCAETKNNAFNLTSLENFDNIITTEQVHNIKVLPILSTSTLNVVKTNKENIIQVQRLKVTDLHCEGYNVRWQEIENASVYNISLYDEEKMLLDVSTDLAYFSMKNYNAGNYTINVQAIAGDSEDGNLINYISSQVVSKNIVKHNTIEAELENYVLNFENLGEDACLVEFNIDGGNNFSSTISENSISLTDYNFSVGEHLITIKRLGDENIIDSNETVVRFVQLEKIEDITVSNANVSVVRNSINENALITFKISGSTLSEDIIIVGENFEINTTNKTAENYLPSGVYTTKLYVYGDGSTTFSYRENGVSVATATIQFEVLEAPTCVLNDTAVEKFEFNSILQSENYGVYILNGDTTKISVINGTEYEFELVSGSVTYAVQAMGNGVNTLNSCLSEPITITRLSAPILKFNNTTNVVSIEDLNDATVVEKYVFTHNAMKLDYDFSSALTMKDQNEFTVIAIAKAGSDGDYYLNSTITTLNLEKISNSATIELDEENNLVITPTSHNAEYSLEIVFGLTSGSEIFVSNEGQLASVNNTLNYTFVDGKYVVDLIDDNYNAIVDEMVDQFTVSVKFIQKSTGDDSLVNSDYTTESNLNLIRIDSETAITLNAENKIVLTPENHTQEYELRVVINNGADMVFVSSHKKLICAENSVELPYLYKDGSYYITLLNEDFTTIISNLNSSFSVKVRYSYNAEGADTDLDSDYCANKTISVQPVSAITRDGQNLKITNIKDTYTYLNYSLLVNNYPISLDATATNVEGYIIVDIEYIYNHADANKYIQDINTVEVVVENIETSTENPILSTKGGSILVEKTEAVVVSSYKYNNNEDGKKNNSAVVKFETYTTPYSKQYIVDFYSGTDKVNTIIYVDSDAVNGIISFNMDDIDSLSSVSGMIDIVVNVQTAGTYTSSDGTINVFNSNNAEHQLNKVSAPTGINVSNSTISFNEVSNAVGYEIWEITGTGEVKFNTNLILATSYEISNITSEKQFVVKAISADNGYTNSSFSEIIKVNKVATPTVSVVNGKFNVKLSTSIISLLTNSNISIIPEITNGLNEKVTFNLNDLDGEELKLEISLFTPILVAEPYLFLSYNSSSLLAETLSMKLKIEQTTAVEGVYYLNSDAVSIDCHGLFEPSSLKKTTDENDSVEMITWTASDKNVLNGSALSVGYIFKIEYTNEDGTSVYYSDDSDLKYYDKTSGSYKSYAKIITGNSAIFPAGYGLEDEENLQVKFTEGFYKVSVQAVPLTTISGYNLCSSKYSTPCEFEIMSKSTLQTMDGKVVWDAQNKADYYIVSIYEQGATTPLLVDKTSEPSYDFTNSSLNTLAGVYSVVVKAISTREDALNSAESEPYYVYRLPKASAVYVDDGHLVLTASAFLVKAKVELVDTLTGTIYELPLIDNEEESTKNLLALNIEKWDSFTDEALINTTKNYAVSVDNDVLRILDGRDYTINVTLFGNTHEKLGLITSTKTTSLSSMVATKLKPNAIEVSLGIVQFKPDGNYATISAEGVYSSIVNMNYLFNGTAGSTFWNSTTVYKVVITTAEGPNTIYAVDYYSLTTAINNGSISSSEYQLLNDSYGMFAWVMYPYTDGEETKTLYFNVFKENKINLRDYDEVIHYSLVETMENGVNKFTSGTTSVEIDLVGTITIDVYMLGGDSVVDGDKIVACLSAQSNDINQFERYGKNELTSVEGKVQFKNLTPIVEETAIDNPIYKIVLTSINSVDSTVYYIYHTTLEDAESIAKRHDPENYQNAIFLQIGNDEGTVYEQDDTIIFDLSKYISYGTYKASIRTLAGLGKEGVDVDDYYINAKLPGVEYAFFKLSDTQFTSNNGVLEFNQSYITQDGEKIYNDNYEITIYDKARDVDYVYIINRNSDGVKINDSTHVVTYVVPAQITVEQGEIAINGGMAYGIKIRAIAKDTYTLNGTYYQHENEDYALDFEKSLGISELEGEKLRIENGMLKWKVLDVENHTYTIIKISFLDENSQVKNLFIKVSDENKEVVNGEYQYHYYEFTDEMYPLETAGSVYIQDKLLYNIGDGAKEERFVNYEISAYTVGKSTESKNVLNSNYTAKFETNRLSEVQNSTILTQDGILTWLGVDNAVSYKIVLTSDKEYIFTTTETMLDLSNEELPVGKYSVKIKAIGNNNITSMMSKEVTEFTQLDVVDVATIQIKNSAIVWGAVENAQGYKIEFAYTTSSGYQNTLTEIVETTSYQAPTDISGRFTINISAVGVGEGKVFNGKHVTFTSSNDTPTQVSKIEFDAENSRFVIEVKNADFLTGDSLLIVYNFAEYISHSDLANVKLVSKEIGYLQAGSYKKIDDETYHYYYPITVIGKYSNISVQVVRPGTVPSNAVETTDVEFKLFSYGAGTVENPFRIANAEHLLNITYFNSSNYILTSSIDMSSINYIERLNDFDAVISEEFGGTLDGNNYSIFGFNKDTVAKTDTISLTGVENFALFKTLNSATIKNLTFGEENYQLILSNTFANNVANVINLSLIATGANNSTIDNVDVLNFKVSISGDSTNTKIEQLQENVYISALVNTMNNGKIINSNVNFAVSIDIKATNDVYLGGMVAHANGANIEASTITFAPAISTDSTISYLGGVVAYYVGNTNRTTGMKNVTATMNFTSVKSVYVGGIAGFARYISIDVCETEGTYTNRNINYDSYMGGLVGYAQSSVFNNSGTKVNFAISVSDSTNKYFGAVAGMITIVNGISSTVTECYMCNYAYVEKTTITTSVITMGIYTHKDSAVTITDCYKKEQ